MFPENLHFQKMSKVVCVEQLENTHIQLDNAKTEVQKPFPQEEELAAKTTRLNELNALLNLDKREMRSWTVSEARRSRKKRP